MGGYRVQTDSEYKLIILLENNKNVKQENHIHHTGSHEIQIPTVCSLFFTLDSSHVQYGVCIFIVALR